MTDHPVDRVFHRQNVRLHLLEVTAHRVPVTLACLEQVLRLHHHVHRAAHIEVLCLLDAVFYALDQVLDGLFQLIDALLRIFDDRVDLRLDLVDVLFDLVLGFVKQLLRRLTDAFPLIHPLGDRRRHVRSKLRHRALDAARKAARRIERPLTRTDDLVYLGLDFLTDRTQLCPRQPSQLALKLLNLLQLRPRVVLLRHRVRHRLLQIIHRRTRHVQLMSRLAHLAHRLQRDPSQLARRALDLRHDAARRIHRLLRRRARRHRHNLRDLLRRSLRRRRDLTDARVHRTTNLCRARLRLRHHARHIFARRSQRFLRRRLSRFQMPLQARRQTIRSHCQPADQPLDRIEALLTLAHR